AREWNTRPPCAPSPTRRSGADRRLRRVLPRPAVAVRVIAHDLRGHAHPPQPAFQAHRLDLPGDETVHDVEVPGVPVGVLLEAPLGDLAVEVVQPPLIDSGNRLQLVAGHLRNP